MKPQKACQRTLFAVFFILISLFCGSAACQQISISDQIKSIQKKYQTIREDGATVKIFLVRRIKKDGFDAWRISGSVLTGQPGMSATLYRSRHETAQIEIAETTPSGDWSMNTRYGFRPDGSLELLESKLNTFYGNVTTKTTIHFDKQGKKLYEGQTVSDLETGKPVKREFADRQPKIYPTLDEMQKEFGCIGF